MKKINQTYLTVAIIVIVIIGIIVFYKPVPEETIKIGGIFPLTGIGASAGLDQSKAAQLAIDEINGKGGINGYKLKFILEDVSIDKLPSAPNSVNKLINIDNVVGIIGPMWDEPTQIIAPITEKNQVIIVGDFTRKVVETSSFDYAFSHYYDAEYSVEAILFFIQESGFKKIAIITPIRAGFWAYTREWFINKSGNYGIEIVEDIDVGDPQSSDFRTIITKVKNKNPDAVFMVLNDFNQCTFLKQVRELDLDVPIFSTEAAHNGASLDSCSDIMEEKVFIAYPKETEDYGEFIEKFKEKYGKEPIVPSAVTTYDGTMALIEAIKDSKLQGKEALKNSLHMVSIKGYSSKVFSFDEDGFRKASKNDFIIKTVKNNQFIELK